MLDLSDIQESEIAPPFWNERCSESECRLHQLSPYIGKLKSTIASDLVKHFSEPGELVLDPFCGSGTVPLEAMLAGRSVLAFDSNLYATVLTRAKLAPPSSLASAKVRLLRILEAAKRRPTIDLRTVPAWVRRFFHPKTLRESIAYADECIARRDYFLLACFLGILHHQRPGFLSYPSSHLVPYLRDRKYPRDSFPEMYLYRELDQRLERKVERALQDGIVLPKILSGSSEVRRSRVENISIKANVDAVITSPPYMNALDYHRDNRLRLWFLDRSVADYSPEVTDKREAFEQLATALAARVLPRLRPGGYCVLVVGETVRRKRMTSHPAARIADALARTCTDLHLIRVIDDQIPDVRRSRRYDRGTKMEKILVFRKTMSRKT